MEKKPQEKQKQLQEKEKELECKIIPSTGEYSEQNIVQAMSQVSIK